MDKIYGVIFKDGGKTYFFKSSDEYSVGDYVIVETERGYQFGKISALDVPSNNENHRLINRKADENDYEEHLKNLKDADKALKKCLQFVKELELKMNVINAQFTFDRSQLLFNFTADERIDFRELARKLAGIYHTRIELRQVGVRDKAKEVGGIGVCGKKLCCANFLNSIEAVSMNMAKNQNLALNPAKINGVCGRLLCCLSYEDDQYLECSKGMPSIGDEIKTKNGKGIVKSIDVLNRKCSVLINGNKEDVFIDEDNKK